VFEKVDLRDKAAVLKVVERHGITHVMHLAAESHVTDPSTGRGILSIRTSSEHFICWKPAGARGETI